MKTSFFYSLLFLLSSTFLYSQDTDYIYAINNAAPGEFYFAKVNIETGELTNFDLAFNQLSSATSVCTNEENGDMMVFTGSAFQVFHTAMESMGPTTSLPIPIGNTFAHPEYNVCDSTIYGLEYSDGSSLTFSKYHVPSGTYENLNTVSNFYSCYGCMTMLDPENGQYMINSNGVHYFDLETGDLINSAPIFEDVNQSFGHLSMHCDSKEIFGTSASLNDFDKHFAKLDSSTGEIIIVSVEGWTDGYYKPAKGENDIDYTRNQYVYSGSGGQLVFIEIATGQHVNTISVPGSQFYFIQHFSSCECPSTTVPVSVSEVTPEALRVGPNPVIDEITFFLGEERQMLTIFDGQGRQVLNKNISGTSSINLSGQAAGLHYWTLKDEKGFIQSGSLMKR